ncbi:Tn7 transposase TnsA N-terminal domain-containing protein [Pseudomonas qingdaonensis]|nr:Tn7 transposase TnsA N-terminal domain-containing protein [Pseudomonas qingdaonensis]
MSPISVNSFRCGSKIRCASPRSLACPTVVTKGTQQVLTSDFLVDFEDPQRPSIAIQAKYSTDLQKPEVIERLELEGATGRKRYSLGHRH